MTFQKEQTIEELKPIKKLTISTKSSALLSVSVSDDQRYIFCAGNHNDVALVDAMSMEKIAEFDNLFSGNYLRMSTWQHGEKAEDCKHACTSSGGDVVLFRHDPSDLKIPFKPYIKLRAPGSEAKKDINACSWHTNPAFRSILAVAQNPGVINVFDTDIADKHVKKNATPEITEAHTISVSIKQISVNVQYFHDVSFSPSGRLLAAVCGDSVVLVATDSWTPVRSWNTPRGQTYRTSWYLRSNRCLFVGANSNQRGGTSFWKINEEEEVERQNKSGFDSKQIKIEPHFNVDFATEVEKSTHSCYTTHSYTMIASSRYHLCAEGLARSISFFDLIKKRKIAGAEMPSDPWGLAIWLDPNTRKPHVLAVTGEKLFIFPLPKACVEYKVQARLKVFLVTERGNAKQNRIVDLMQSIYNVKVLVCLFVA